MASSHYLTVLWRARPWPQHTGRAYFTRLTWIYTGSHPKHTASRPDHHPAAQTKP